MSRPEKVFKAGAVRASVFLNTMQRDGVPIPIRKVVIEVRYRDRYGEWKGSNSLSLNEIPKAITALQQAYEYLLEQGAHDRNPGNPGHPGSPGQPGRPPAPPDNPESPGNSGKGLLTTWARSRPSRCRRACRQVYIGPGPAIGGGGQR